MTCSRCEALPDPVIGPVTLYLWMPLGHSRSKLRLALKHLGLRALEPEGDCLAVDLASADAVATVAGLLVPEEARATRSILMPAGGVPSLADVGRVGPLDELVARLGAGWLVEMLREERYTTHFQAIVPASRPGEPIGHECLFRGLDESGGILSPGRVFGSARAASLLFQVDRAARLSAISEAARLGLAGNLFINFTPTAIYDPVNCLASTYAAIGRAGLSPDRVVFEVIESDEVRNVDHLLEILKYYRERGFRVALDDLGSGYSSLNLLHRLRPDFVKLDMQLIRGVHADPYKATMASRLLGLARDLGVLSVAEGVETPEELAWVREHGADYVQGYLVARPGNPPRLDAAFAVA